MKNSSNLTNVKNINNNNNSNNKYESNVVFDDDDNENDMRFKNYM